MHRSLLFVALGVFGLGCAASMSTDPDDPKKPSPGPPSTPAPDSGGPVCNTPNHDCNHDGYCDDVASDPQNCGGCGRDCGGGACSNGTCSAVMLATGQPLSNFAIDAEHVYWTQRIPNVSYCMVKRIEKTGANVATMHDSKVVDYQNCTGALAVDKDNVYWASLATTGILRMMPKGNSDGMGLVERSLTVPNALASDDTNLFWQDIDGAIVKMDRALQGNPIALAPAATALAGQLAVDGTNVYGVKWASDYKTADLIAVPKLGGASVVTQTGEKMYGLRVDGSKLAYATTKAVRDLDPQSQAKTDVATNLPSGTGYALDADYVYFADMGTGSVLQIPRSGSATPIVLSTGYKNTCTKTCTDGFDSWPCSDTMGPCDAHSVRHLEVDDGFVYFLDDALSTMGRVWKVAKWRDVQ